MSLIARPASRWRASCSRRHCRSAQPSASAQRSASAQAPPSAWTLGTIRLSRSTRAAPFGTRRSAATAARTQGQSHHPLGLALSSATLTERTLTALFQTGDQAVFAIGPVTLGRWRESAARARDDATGDDGPGHTQAARLAAACGMRRCHRGARAPCAWACTKGAGTEPFACHAQRAPACRAKHALACRAAHALACRAAHALACHAQRAPHVVRRTLSREHPMRL
jgi:hypothetical protein